MDWRASDEPTMKHIVAKSSSAVHDVLHRLGFITLESLLAFEQRFAVVTKNLVSFSTEHKSTAEIMAAVDIMRG